ncbi:MAG: ATP-binding protein [Stigonema ocellatum SAG 48.90 = DSM 106950]|nr:ATP-binding protein [Stigonema ocellatum SAG 48.90 = DSM 106950]
MAAGKVRVYQRVDVRSSLGSFIRNFWSEVNTSNFAAKDLQSVNNLINELSGIEQTLLEADVESILTQIRDTAQNLGARAKKALNDLHDTLSSAWENSRRNPPLPEESRVTVPELVSQINDSRKDNLFVIQSHDPNELRSFSRWLGNEAYEQRRRTGQISPLVSFIFDEADEFIPQDASGTYRDSTEIAMTLARRGRKFGLGIGIATQRITYLDTSIIAQPHTYFVSKLPRKSDQDRIRDAFGLSDEMFRQTVKFKKGDWLLVSYDATGLEAVPLPIHTPNANERLANFLQTYSD